MTVIFEDKDTELNYFKHAHPILKISLSSKVTCLPYKHIALGITVTLHSGVGCLGHPGDSTFNNHLQDGDPHGWQILATQPRTPHNENQASFTLLRQWKEGGWGTKAQKAPKTSKTM